MKKNELSNYLFVVPIIILFIGFIVYPIIYNIVISFYSWNGVNIHKDYVGIANYNTLLKDPVMYKVVNNYVIFALSTILIQSTLGVIFASLLIHKVKFGGLYRTLMYLPIVATPAIIGNIFSKIFETNRGYLNGMLRALHLDSLCQQWLAVPKIALGCIIFVNIWQWTGNSMLIYYANMLNIPDELYEAAKIDGANGFKAFVKITLPLLRGTHYTLFILGMIGSLKTFDIPYMLTRGGPNHATEFFSTYINTKSFTLFKQGESSAIAVIMIFIALIITAVQLKFYYRKDKDKELAG